MATSPDQAWPLTVTVRLNDDRVSIEESANLPGSFHPRPAANASPSITPVIYNLYSALPSKSSTGRKTSRRYFFSSANILFVSVSVTPKSLPSSSVNRCAFGPTQPTANRASAILPLFDSCRHRNSERRTLIAMQTLIRALHAIGQRGISISSNRSPLRVRWRTYRRKSHRAPSGARLLRCQSSPKRYEPATPCPDRNADR